MFSLAQWLSDSQIPMTVTTPCSKSRYTFIYFSITILYFNMRHSVPKIKKADVSLKFKYMYVNPSAWAGGGFTYTQWQLWCHMSQTMCLLAACKYLYIMYIRMYNIYMLTDIPLYVINILQKFITRSKNSIKIQ